MTTQTATLPAPDLFTSVHKGIRRALFELTLALGRAADTPAESQAERALARDVVGFLRQHGDNEDALVLPLREGRAPEVHELLRRAHAEVDAVVDAFEAAIDDVPTPALYTRACHLTSTYLDHIRTEEVELEPRIRSVLTHDELRAVGAASISRTPEAQRPRMLAFVLAAIPRPLAEAQLAKLPPALASELRPRLD